MGIRVLGAAVHLPAPRQPDIKTGSDAPLRCARPFDAAATLSADAAKPVVLAALEMAKTTADQVDMLIGRGLSPTHVADSPDVLGPRTPHAVQRECRLVNAFVFDVLDCDVNFNLDLAETFLVSQGFDRAVLVHTECTAPAVRPDRDSGFSMADGVSALVITRDASTPMRKGSYRNVTGYEGARMEILPPDERVAGELRAALSFPWAAGLIDAIDAAGNQVLAAELAKAGDLADLCFGVEDWFDVGIDAEALAGKRVALDPGVGHPGSHTLTAMIAKRLDAGHSGRFLGVTVDPWAMRCGAGIVAFGGAA